MINSYGKYSVLCSLLIILVLCLDLKAVEAVRLPNDAYVHDPSIILADDGMYYIYGSHMAAARSADLIDWEMLSTDAGKGCTLVEDVQTQMSEALNWAKTSTFWAPDVERLNDGRYYMYYCCCEGSSPLSAMGLAVSDSPDGPFEDLGIFLKSGMNGLSEDGTPYNANIHPNVIDAHVFRDKDDKLWMVYGSYSGGIYILEMDGDSGFPLPGQGYGKKLLGKNHSRIEGPYIMYSPDTDYYYLFLSFGGLDSSGGYNIRVCRSKNPDGPYEDALGQDMIDCGGPTGSFFDDKAIEGYGVKLMGSFRFMPLPGVTALPEAAYKSPGHNSAVYDDETGDYFLVFHTRFSAKGEEHRVRVHQFWFNEEGWPVVSPLRYVGGIPDDVAEVETDEDFSGEYRLIRHGRDINKTQHRSTLVNFHEDNSFDGEINGEWQIDGEQAGNREPLGTLVSKKTGRDGKVFIDGMLYEGLFTTAYDFEQNAWVRVITMLSEDGEALWGIRTNTQ